MHTTITECDIKGCTARKHCSTSLHQGQNTGWEEDKRWLEINLHFCLPRDKDGHERSVYRAVHICPRHVDEVMVDKLAPILPADVLAAFKERAEARK